MDFNMWGFWISKINNKDFKQAFPCVTSTEIFYLLADFYLILQSWAYLQVTIFQPFLVSSTKGS